MSERKGKSSFSFPVLFITGCLVWCVIAMLTSEPEGEVDATTSAAPKPSAILHTISMIAESTTPKSLLAQEPTHSMLHETESVARWVEQFCAKILPLNRTNIAIIQQGDTTPTVPLPPEPQTTLPEQVAITSTTMADLFRKLERELERQGERHPLPANDSIRFARQNAERRHAMMLGA